MLSQTEGRLLHALKSRAGREKHAAFAVEGVRVVEDMLAARLDLKFAVVSPTLEDSERGRGLIEALATRTPVRRVSDRELREVADTETPQGIIAVARAPHHKLADRKPETRALVTVLDAIQDPGNLGTLIRSADAFAADCVIALPGTVDYWNPKVVRSAAGAAFRVPLISAPDDEVWSWLSSNRFAVCGADMRGEAIGDLKVGERIALVVGNEGSGLRKATRAHVTHVVAIPMPGRA
ncbi:MAG: TrmH family RNA methyltransferase [Gemmatimonadota bacterium]